MTNRLIYAVCFFFLWNMYSYSQTNWVPFNQQPRSDPKINLISSDKNGVSLEITVNGMNVSEKRIGKINYKCLSLQDRDFITDPGSPMMPIITKLISVPDCENISLSISASNSSTLSNYYVIPAPRYVEKESPDNLYKFLDPEYEENKSIYTSNSDFPNKYGKIIETGYMRSQKVVRIALYPVQFNPVEKIIIAYSNFNVNLTFTNPSSPVNKELGIFRNIMNHISVNYKLNGISASTKNVSNKLKGDLQETIGGSVTRVTDLSTLIGENAIPVDYLIVTHSSLFNSNTLTTLANHRKDYNNFDIAIVKVDNDVYSTYPRNHHYTSIHDFIKDVYLNGKANHTGDGHLAYICLLGDALLDNDAGEMLPASYAYTNGYDAASDYYYACLTDNGDWDNIQDVMYGRISVGNEDELSSVTNKILIYENGSFWHWSDKCIFVSSSPSTYADADPCIAEMTQIVPPIYPRSYGYRAKDTDPPTQVVEADPIYGQRFTSAQYNDPGNLCGSDLLNNWLYDQINYGAHTFVFEGHGGWPALNGNEGCGRTIFYVPEGNCVLNNNITVGLTNAFFYPFTIFNCCETGEFDHSDGDCLAEEVVNLANKGAIGVLASTRESVNLAFGVVDNYVLDAQYNDLSFVMGESVMESKIRMTSILYRRQYNLYGDPAINLWPYGENISEDLILQGTINITSDVTIDEGVTLTILPETNISFSNKASLLIFGTLNANSQGGQAITFKADGTEECGSIIFDGTSSANSVINGVHINNGAGIRCLNGADILIENSIFEQCGYGLYIYNSEPRIINNHIINPSGNGIYGEASGLSPLIQGNTIYKSNQQGEGIYLNNCTDPYITGNDIQGFNDGLYYGGGGIGYFTDYSYSTPEINNRLTDNRNGLNVTYGSYLFAGGYTKTRPPELIGNFNSLCGNSIYDARAEHSSVILAEQNWWGDGAPHIYTSDHGVIDATNPLNYDPWAGPPPGKALTNIKLLNPGEEDDDILWCMTFEKQERTGELIALCRHMLEQNSHPKFALVELIKLIHKYHFNNLKDYLDSLLVGNRPFKAAVMNHLASLALENDKYNAAMLLYDQIIANYPGSEYAINALFEKFFAVLLYKNDRTLAGELLEELEALGLTDDDFLLRLATAESLFNSTPNGSHMGKKVTSNDNIPKKYELLGNFPNPFNPSTKISYSLPYYSSVELIIYDILGRQVKSFNVSSQSTGVKNISWDGTNNDNSPVSSGIYLYRIKIKSLENSETFIKTAKLMLLK